MPGVFDLILPCLLWAATGAADPTRYALVIGANHGTSEAALSYATSDAQRFVDVLTTLGGFLPDNIVLLSDPDADRVRDALARLNARMRGELSSGDNGLLLVFYSGHADAGALHLSNTALPWDELRNTTAGAAAALRLLIVDACRSGQVTHVKGIQVDAPFAITPSEPPPEGFAMLSSAAAGESAMESEALGGSFFSHHLIAGLRGAADADHDGVVTLAEAYAYAADRTRASTASTVAGVQHPTYAYGLKGRRDVALTHLDAHAEDAVVTLTSRGEYLLWREQRGGHLAADVVSTDGRTRLALPSGTYFVQLRATDRLYEGETTFAPGLSTSIGAPNLRPVAYDVWARKGGETTAAAMSLWSGASTSPATGFGVGTPVRLMMSWTFAQLSLDASVGGWHAGAAAASPVDQRVWGLEAGLGARRMLDIGPASLGLGLRGALLYSWQSFATTRLTTPGWTIGPAVDTFGRIDVHLPRDVFIGFEAALRASLLRRITAGIDAHVSGIAQLGVGVQW